MEWRLQKLDMYTPVWIPIYRQAIYLFFYYWIWYTNVQGWKNTLCNHCLNHHFIDSYEHWLNFGNYPICWQNNKFYNWRFTFALIRLETRGLIILTFQENHHEFMWSISVTILQFIQAQHLKKTMLNWWMTMNW